MPLFPQTKQLPQALSSLGGGLSRLPHSSSLLLGSSSDKTNQLGVGSDRLSDSSIFAHLPSRLRTQKNRHSGVLETAGKALERRDLDVDHSNMPGRLDEHDALPHV
jgi:hypothetical protein